MIVVKYCDECTKCFTVWPYVYWTMYTKIVEEMIIHGKCYTLIAVVDDSTSYTNDLIRCLEEAGLALSCDQGKEEVKIMPMGVHCLHSTLVNPSQTYPNLVKSSHYLVCLSKDSHFDQVFDENLAEE